MKLERVKAERVKLERVRVERVKMVSMKAKRVKLVSVIVVRVKVVREKMVKSLKGDEAEGGEDGDAGLECKENALMSFPSYCGMSATLHFEKTVLESMAQSIWYPSAVGAVAGAGTDAATGADAFAWGEGALLLL
jgi:hypothetical protein